MFQAIGAHGPVLGPMASLLLDVLLLGTAFWMLSSPKNRTYSEIILFITLITAVSLLRVLMTPLPNIQPVTIAALLVGAQLGAERGIAFAVLVTMISNFIIGNGICTLYQAIGWSVVAIIGANFKLVVNNQPNYPRIYVAAIGSAFLFDFIVSLSIMDGTVGFSQFLIYLANGIPYDFMHALGNITFAAWFTNWFVRVLQHQPTLDEIEVLVVEGHGIES